MADVSGTWLGTYWQEGLPTRFEATFLQSGNAFNGSILDDSDLGEAQISGEVIGRTIRFTKRYLTRSGETVSYTGSLSEEEDFMQGNWSLGRAGSGPWEARRSGDNLIADLQQRVTQQLALSGGSSAQEGSSL